jgi:hypothetical protein
MARERLYQSSIVTHANVAASATVVDILALSNSRLGASVYNDSTADLYLKLGSAASATSFTAKLVGGGYFEVPYGYTGLITGLWASATGSARVAEYT